MEETRVYFNSENFNASFTEEDKVKLIEKSKLKIQRKNLHSKCVNLKLEYSYLIKEKNRYSINFQDQYNKMIVEHSRSEGNEIWLKSSEREILVKMYHIIKNKNINTQKELTIVKKEIRSLGRKISKLI